ncbi:MAG TPA: hypothetical protein VFE42_35685 [Chloroflexota bacterium]|nr:hypothetical protein [Chloroflexota bacterium]
MAVPTVMVIGEGTKPWSAVMKTGTVVRGWEVAVAVGVSDGGIAVVAVGPAAVIVGVAEGRLVDVAVGVEVSAGVGLSVGVELESITMMVPVTLKSLSASRW